MDLTAANLVEALSVCTGGQVDDLADVVDLVRKEQPSFAATIFAAWEAEGKTLSPLLRLELDYARDRFDFYRSLADKVKAAVPGLTTVKGLEVAALYPEGLVRTQNDLDFIAPSQTQLWQGVAFVTDLGWRARTATFAKLDGTLQIMVNTTLPNEDEYRAARHIEFGNYYTLGNSGGIPPVLKFRDEWLNPAAIKNFLMLLHERYEQPFRARDLVDAALMSDSLDDSQHDTLHAGIVALDLAVAYNELVRLVAQTGMPPLRPLRGGQLATTLVRARRTARGAGLFAKPLAGSGRHLQRRVMQSDPGRAEGAVWDVVQRQLPVKKAVEAGLLAFGLPVSGPKPELTAATLHSRGDVAWAETPAGRFLLTLGDYVTQAAVDELTENDDSAAAAEVSPETDR